MARLGAQQASGSDVVGSHVAKGGGNFFIDVELEAARRRRFGRLKKPSALTGTTCSSHHSSCCNSIGEAGGGGRGYESDSIRSRDSGRSDD